jgi:hypothetical protein
MTPFDIEFVVPISLKEEKYATRAETFLKYGLINIENKQILLTLICFESERDDMQSLVASFGKVENTKIVTSDGHHPAVKIYQYLSNYDTNNARWMAKVDDDSITDVSTLVDKLDQHYDWTKDYHIISNPARKETHGIELDLMKKYNLLSNDFIHTHEWEISITSNQTMRTIRDNPMAMQIMSDRSKIPDGYCDQTLAIAAKVCKIYPTECSFITYHPYIGVFSYFGGYMTHIHFVSHDKNPHCLRYFLNRFENKFEVESDRDIFNTFENKEFFFSPDKTQGVILTLSNTGRIINHATNSPTGRPVTSTMLMADLLWSIRNGNLEFLNMEGKPTTIFKNVNINTMMKGKTTTTPITEKVLRVIDLKS